MDFLMILLTTSLIMSVIMLGLFLLSSLSPGQKLNAQTRYAMWVILLVGLVVPFRPLLGDGLIRLDSPMYEISSLPDGGERISETDTNVNEKKESLSPHTRPSSEEGAEEISVPIRRRLSIPGLLFAVWAGGALILFAKHILEYREFQRIIKRWGKSVSDPQVLETFEWLKAKMGLEDKKIGLIRCGTISTPMLTGLFKPMVLLPEKPIADDEMELILEHELTHYKHKDLLINLIGIIALCLHWFNPFIYLCLPVIYGDGESYCDESVLKNKDVEYRRFYGEVIISMIETSPRKPVALSTCFYAKKINLKRRLLHIMESGKKRKSLSISSVALIFALTIVSGSVIVFAAPSTQGVIDENKAVKIALDNAGVSADAVALDGVELDRNGMRPVYEVDFHEGSTEYSYTIDTVTGRVLRSEKEKKENERASLPSDETSSKAPVRDESRGEKEDKTAEPRRKGEVTKPAEEVQGTRTGRKERTEEEQEKEAVSSDIENETSEKTKVPDSSKIRTREEEEENRLERPSSSEERQTEEAAAEKTKDEEDEDEDEDEDSDDEDDN